MKEKAHRRISEEVAKKLWRNRDCETLVIATATFDWPDTDIRHHPAEDRDNVTQIQILTRRARHQYLETGFSPEFQCRLGDIFHLIQDGFISSDEMDTHNLIEGQVSRCLEQSPFYGIDAKSLTTEAQVFGFLRREVRPLEDAEEILLSAFRVCLSIGKAITSPRGNFKLAQQTHDLIREADGLLQEAEEQARQWKNETDKFLEPYETYFGSQVSEKEVERERSLAAARASVLRRIISALRQEERRYQQEIQDLEKKKATWLGRSKVAKERQLNRLLEQAAKVASTLQKLKNVLARGYQSRHEFMERNASWLGIDVEEFRTPRELQSIIVDRETRLCAIPLMCGDNARQLGISVEPKFLSALRSYPVFGKEFGPQVTP